MVLAKGNGVVSIASVAQPSGARYWKYPVRGSNAVGYHHVSNRFGSESKKRGNFGVWTGYLAALTNLLGGLSLFTASFLPDEPQQMTAVESQVASQSPSASQIRAHEKDVMQTVKEVMETFGWACIGTCMLAGTTSQMVLGMKEKQPSMVGAAATIFGMAPFMMMDPSVPLRMAFMGALAWFFGGWANAIHNKRVEQTGTGERREWDMKPLMSVQALREQRLLGPNADEALMRTWFRELGGMTAYTLGDVGRVVTTGVGGLLNGVCHPVETGRKAFGHGRDLARYGKQIGSKLLGRNSDPLETPACLIPSDSQYQMSAMIMYCGVGTYYLPLLIMGGPIPVLTKVASGLIGAGVLSANASLFALGASKGNLAGKGLMVGMPLKTVAELGNVLGYPFGVDLGLGVDTQRGFGGQSAAASTINFFVADENANPPADEEGQT